MRISYRRAFYLGGAHFWKLTRRYWWEFKYLISPSIFNFFQLFLIPQIAPPPDLSIAGIKKLIMRVRRRWRCVDHFNPIFTLPIEWAISEILLLLSIFNIFWWKIHHWNRLAETVFLSYQKVISEIKKGRTISTYLPSTNSTQALMYTKNNFLRFPIFFQGAITFPPY